jgi:hypothetical protein
MIRPLTFRSLRRQSVKIIAASLAIQLAAASRDASAMPTEVRPIVRSNQFAPGAGSARYLGFFPGAAVVNDQGQIAFEAVLFGAGVNISNDHGIWLSAAPGGPHSLVARFGNRPPGLPVGSRYTEYFETLGINNAGAVAFVAGIEPTAQPVDTGAWTTAGGPLRLLAADGYAIPGAPAAPAPTEGVRNPLMNDAGQTTFITNFDNATLWVDTPGQPLRRVVSTGDSLPGGFNLQADFLGHGLIHSNGSVTFSARITSPGVPSTSFGIWSDASGSLQLVAREGGPLPGAAGTIQSYNYFELSSTNLLSLDANLNDSTDSRVITVQRPDGSWRLAAQTNQPIPGTSERLANFYAHSINAQGHVAFPGFLEGDLFAPGPTSVWAENDAGLELIAQAGQLAPGAGRAVFRLFENIQFNDFGDLLFEAYLMDGVGGVTNDNNQGIWLRTRNGRLTLVAREGSFLDTDPGPAENLQRIFALDSIQALPNLITTQRRTLTNRGEVLFSAEFYNGPSGLFLTHPVPEPNTATISFAALALSGLIYRRRERAQ